MGKITDTVKFLLILNVIFYIGSFIIGDLSIKLFALYYFENPNFQYWQPLTHMFMHDPTSIFHILFNMYALWAFGSPLEMRWGQKKFLFFYFSAGLGAAAIHTLVNYFQLQNGMDALMLAGMDHSQIMDFLNTGRYNTAILDYVSQDTVQNMYNNFNGVALGASGAVYGVLVAFGIMFPNIELMLIFLPIPIKAKYFIPGIILLDLVFGITGTATGIAHWAHIGGALFGFIMAWYWKKNSFDTHRWN
ncbi:rhomboid family intramembrane serine protease [Vitellibacter sp. q18]|jgi:membrane associated rhomboid family serine protease|nr:rhomboid family intramembrane serine protease [Aequorivita lutea]